jgi:hypothetical protein
MRFEMNCDKRCCTLASRVTGYYKGPSSLGMDGLSLYLFPFDGYPNNEIEIFARRGAIYPRTNGIHFTASISILRIGRECAGINGLRSTD